MSLEQQPPSQPRPHPKVSVSMLTYNHEKFIAQAIESVLMQKTNFDYELIIGEDCSTDSTRAIVMDYQRRYPDKIRALLPEKNSGMFQNSLATQRACVGQYTASLEGDDYWTSPNKLQKQVDFLELHHDCSLCFHGVEVRYDNGSPGHPYHRKQLVQTKYSLEDFLRGQIYIPTCSVMIRNSVFSGFPDWYYSGLSFGDKPLILLCAERGSLGFIDESLAVYRIHSGGVWSLGIGFQAPIEVQKKRFTANIQYYELADVHLAYKYHHIIREQIARFCYELAWLYQKEGNWKKMREHLIKAYRAKQIGRASCRERV